jgi:hypothetical protein
VAPVAVLQVRLELAAMVMSPAAFNVNRGEKARVAACALGRHSHASASNRAQTYQRANPEKWGSKR